MSKTKELTDEEYEQKVDDWTEFNPQTMMDRSVDGLQLCKDLKIYIQVLAKKHSESLPIKDEIDSLDSKINDLVDHYESLVHDIKMWWQYSHDDDDDDDKAALSEVQL